MGDGEGVLVSHESRARAVGSRRQWATARAALGLRGCVSASVLTVGMVVGVAACGEVTVAPDAGDESDDDAVTEPDASGEPGSDTGEPGGGVDWQTRSGPSGAVALSMAFSPSYGWMAAELDFLWRSEDGGDTWADQGFPATPRDVAAGADDSAWVLASGADKMWVSAGGEPFVEAAEQPGGGTLRGLAAADQDTAAVANDSADDVFTTEDGGEVWVRRELGTGFPGITDLDYAAGTLAAVGGTLSQSVDAANVAVSTDFGENWVTQDLRDEAHDGEGGRLVSIFVTAEGAIWAAGPSRQIYHSAGGGSFEQIEGIPEGLGDFEAIAASESHVVAAGAYEDSSGEGIGIYESVDGGESFSVGHRDTPCDCDVTGAAAHPDGTIWVHTSEGHFLTRRAP